MTNRHFMLSGSVLEGPLYETRIVIPGMLLGTFLAVAGMQTEFRLEPDNLPLNPFDTIDYGEEMLEVLDIDSASFRTAHLHLSAYLPFRVVMTATLNRTSAPFSHPTIPCSMHRSSRMMMPALLPTG